MIRFVVGKALFVVVSNHCMVCYVNLSCNFIVVLISIDLMHNLFVVLLDERNKVV